MVAGATVSVVPAFDLQFENYSWMEYLATAGFDVFAMDVTGYGLSPRPMMDDPCNNSTLTSSRISFRSFCADVRLPTRSTYFAPVGLG
jgi:alpha-beta hydrolase superfamily lysophospholipase